MKEKLCPKHGPYDASLPACPYCSGSGRPPAPPVLGDDDLATDLGYGSVNRVMEGEEPTDIPVHRGRGRAVDFEEDEKTEIKKNRKGDDITEIAVEDTGVQALLWVKEGDRRGHTYKVKDGCVVGRKDGDLVLDDPKVSNPHAKICFENEAFVIWDFGSKNGTFVNGERIRAATALKENDTVKIGDTLFVLKVLG
jgi:hypothetical protein